MDDDDDEEDDELYTDEEMYACSSANVSSYGIELVYSIIRVIKIGFSKL